MRSRARRSWRILRRGWRGSYNGAWEVGGALFGCRVFQLRRRVGSCTCVRVGVWMWVGGCVPMGRILHSPGFTAYMSGVDPFHSPPVTIIERHCYCSAKHPGPGMLWRSSDAAPGRGTGRWNALLSLWQRHGRTPVEWACISRPSCRYYGRAVV